MLLCRRAPAASVSLCFALTLLILVLPVSAHAFSWRVQVGLIDQDPDNKGRVQAPPQVDPEQRDIRLSDDTAGSYAVVFDISPLVSVMLQGTSIFQHKIKLGDSGRIGSFRQNNFYLQGRWYPFGRLEPYVNPYLLLGGYYATLKNSRIDIPDVGFTVDEFVDVQAGLGLDISWGNRVYLNAAVSILQAQTQIKINADGQTFNLPLDYDPYNYEVSVGYRF